SMDPSSVGGADTIQRSGAIPCAVALQDRGEPAAESGDHGLAVEAFAVRDDAFRAILPIDASEPASWIDHPHELRGGLEPVADFGEHLARSIARRKNFHHEIRRHRRVSLGPWIGN